MKKSISRIKKKYLGIKMETIERAFIDSYGKQNKLEFQSTYVIKDFLKVKDYEEISDFITENIALRNLDELVIAFECLIPENDRKSNGVVYTPPEIRQYITKELIETDYIPYIIDPACGCGAFLISAAQLLRSEERR